LSRRRRRASGLRRGCTGPEDDDLIERLRQTVNRSDAKTLALDDLLSQRPTATPSPIEEPGGHRRFTRRRDRLQAEERLDRAEGLEAGAESVLERIGQRRTALEEQVVEWTTWTAEHGQEASSLREVDTLIAEHHRQHQPSLRREQGITRNVEPDVGIDLGL
jgi:hypothetical protein